eukprot:Sdes_comp9108_c0_seq1m570
MALRDCLKMTQFAKKSTFLLRNPCFASFSSSRVRYFDLPTPNPKFDDVFRKDPLALVTDIRGKLVKGHILGFKSEFIYIDLGMKLLAVAPRPAGMPFDSVSPGKKVLVQLRDIEYTKSFLGDSKPTTAREMEVELKYVYEENES